MDFYITRLQKLQKDFASQLVHFNIILFVSIIVQVGYMPQVVIV